MNDTRALQGQPGPQEHPAHGGAMPSWRRSGSRTSGGESLSYSFLFQM